MSATITVNSGPPTELPRDRRFLLGRETADEVVGLDPDDTGISRVAVGVEWRGDVWWIFNMSTKRAIYLEREGTEGRTLVTPRGSQAITTTHTRVLVPGMVFTHQVVIEVPEEDVAIADPSVPTAGVDGTTAGVELTDAERDALTALLAGYLRPHPRHHPHPLNYDEAGDLLGLPASTVRKRIENLRSRLSREGVFETSGPEARYELAEFALGCGLVTREDLERIEAT